MDAQHLVAGDRLLNSDESWSEVVAVAAVEKPLKAYNLTVANDHTYFIAGAAPTVANDNALTKHLAKAVWVHNDCTERILNTNKPNASDPRLQKVYEQLWRDEDDRPGGTAGELLREVANGDGNNSRHYTKALERITQLTDIIRRHGDNMSRLDRKSAEQVIHDLRFAVRKAEGN